MLDQHLIFRSENDAPSQEEYPYDDGKEEKYSLDDLKKRIHTDD